MIPKVAGGTDHAAVIFGASSGISVRSMPSISVTSAQSATTRTWAALIDSLMVVVVLDKVKRQYAWPDEASLPEAAQFVTGSRPALANLHKASVASMNSGLLGGRLRERSSIPNSHHLARGALNVTLWRIQ